jgi:glutamate racemase
MNKLKIIFTDSGLGGINIMADFVRLTHNLDLDILFFNAQYKREQGYKTMEKEQQVKIFDKALKSMQENYNADYIAIACNTLSVIYQNSKYKENSSAAILDIVATGQKLINESAYDTIIEISMPTTVNSGVYQKTHKNVISVAANSELPDAIENNDQKIIKAILKQAFHEVKNELIKQNLQNNKLSLFLGCTHFPFIKNEFFETADEFGINFSELLNPNTEFANLIFDTIRNKSRQTNKNNDNLVKVISRVQLKEREIESISAMIDKYSHKTAEALRNYHYIPDLF